jgi:hypothetical protein
MTDHGQDIVEFLVDEIFLSKILVVRTPEVVGDATFIRLDMPT